MARRGHPYPQVDHRAGGLIDARVWPVPPAMSAAEARHVLRERAAEMLVLPDPREGVLAVPTGRAGVRAMRTVVLAADLERAAALGLGDIAMHELATVVPAVDAADREAVVRRRLRQGAPAVLVLRDGVAVGAVSRRGSAVDVLCGPSVATVLAERLDGDAVALLGEIGEIAQALESRAFLVGGVVRDALRGLGGPRRGLGGPRRGLGGPRRGDATPGGHGRDLDVVVEGDGPGVARRLAAAARGGTVLSHPAFGTSVVEGLGVGRVDVATARRERYAAPGALPDVQFSTIGDDLARRDFTVNAMAVELASGSLSLLDPLGGREDLARDRLRILHPLSFVEDPTRILRAARYAGRLGLRLDSHARKARALAIGLAPYPALSPARIAAEMERVLGDATPAATLRDLADCGAFRLLDARWRATASGRRALDALEAALAWSERHGDVRGAHGDVRRLSLAALAIVADQPEDVAQSVLAAMGFAGEPLAELLRTRAASPELLRDLAGLAGAPPSRRAAALRRRSPIELAWAWLRGGADARDLLEAFVARESRVRSELRGDDVIALGVPAGPAVGQVLERLRDARLDGRVESRESEAAEVRAWLCEPQDGPGLGPRRPRRASEMQGEPQDGPGLAPRRPRRASEMQGEPQDGPTEQEA